MRPARRRPAWTGRASARSGGRAPRTGRSAGRACGPRGAAGSWGRTARAGRCAGTSGARGAGRTARTRSARPTSVARVARAWRGTARTRRSAWSGRTRGGSAAWTRRRTATWSRGRSAGAAAAGLEFAPNGGVELARAVLLEEAEVHRRLDDGHGATGLGLLIDHGKASLGRRAVSAAVSDPHAHKGMVVGSRHPPLAFIGSRLARKLGSESIPSSPLWQPSGRGRVLGRRCLRASESSE